MARRTETLVQLEDDIDGGKAAETVTFAYDGIYYEMDLSAKNAKALRADIGKWAEHARKVKKTPASRARRATAAATKPASEAAAIRAWAVESGIEVPTRGRIPAALVEQYHST